MKLLNPPEEPLSDYLLEVLYSCDVYATVQLDCIVSFDTGITSNFLLRQWSCFPGDHKIRTLKLNLPDWLVYKVDGIVPDSQWVLSCILRASVQYSGFDDTEGSSAAQDVATLQPKPPFSRPVKQHQLCSAWSTQMLQLRQQFLKKQCPLEQGKQRDNNVRREFVIRSLCQNETIDIQNGKQLKYRLEKKNPFNFLTFRNHSDQICSLGLDKRFHDE